MLDIKRALAALNVPERTETFPLETPWGAELSARLARDPGTVPLPEHPRPTLVRDRFTVLNGRWDYAIVTIPGTQGDAPLDAERALETLRAASIPAAFDGTITVPFSPEAALSGVGRTVEPSELLWYRRTVDVPEREPGERLVLHFDAVDWACALWVDGRLAATHVGGYLPFDIDITSYADEATRSSLRSASTTSRTRACSRAASSASSRAASGTPRRAASGRRPGSRSQAPPTSPGSP